MFTRQKLILLSILLCSFTICRCFWEKDKNPTAPDDDVLLDKVEFSGYTWLVRHTEQLEGPGKNYFSASTKNVWVDEDGKLHLKLTKGPDGKWYCSEVYTESNFEYGKYIFYIESSNIETLDPNVVLGLFTWDNDAFPDMANTEIDVEFTKWGNQADPNTSQYSVQPTNGGKFKERQHRPDIPMLLFGSKSMHTFEWMSNKINFASYRGYNTNDLLSKIDEWFFDNTNPARQALNEDTGQTSNPVVIPVPTPGTKVHINLWLYDSDNNKVGNPPNDQKEIEVIIAAFEYRPYSINTQGLVAYYPFNGNANDESGNGNHGTVYGAISTNDRFGNANCAYYFDGINNYILVSNSASLNLKDALTISAWINFSTIPINGSHIVMKSQRAGTYEYGLNLNTQNSGAISASIGGYNVVNVVSNSVTTNTSYYIVATWQYPGVSEIYLNGVWNKSVTTIGNIDPLNCPLTIGRIRPDESRSSYNGIVDDVRIYNRVLSSSEIQALYHEGGW